MSYRHLTEAEVQEIANSEIVVSQIISDHLALCPACSQQVRIYQAMHRAISEQALPVVPAGFADRIIAVTAQKPEKRVMNSYLITCCVVVIIFVVLSGFILNLLQTKLQLPAFHPEKTSVITLQEIIFVSGAIGFVYICISGFRRYNAQQSAFGDLNL